MDAQPIKVVLVDDHQLVREVVARALALECDFRVVGSFSDADAAVMALATAHPDVVLMDVDMPGTDGITATQQICAAWPSLKVVMLTATCTPGQVRSAFAAGACGYLLKDEGVHQLCAGVRIAAGGGRPMASLVEALGAV